MVALQERLQHIARDGLSLGSPGIVVAAVGDDGERSIAAAGISSLQRRDPIRTDHRFAIGSIGKTIAAVIIHQLVEEERLDLNATGGDYLGEDFLTGIANAAEAPLRTMLNHTSGIPSWEFDPDWIRRGRGDEFDPTRPFGKLDTLEYIRNRHPPTGAVGERFSYSNSNHTLLGLIVEQVTRDTFIAEARRRVFEPIGATSFAMESFEPIPDGAMACAHHLASPFFRQTAGIHPSFPETGPGIIDTSAANLSPEWAAGGFVASMNDLATYGAALADNAFGASVGESMRAFRKLEGTPDLPKPRRVGLGLFEYPTPSGPVAGHFGGTLGYCAALLFPAQGTGAVLTIGFNLGRMHTAAEDEHGSWQRWVMDQAYPGIADAE